MHHVDIHCHILPNVDDGPKTHAEALAMGLLAKEEEVSDIIVTPHALHPQFGKTEVPIRDALRQLQLVFDENQLEIKLHLGNEIRSSGELFEALEQGAVQTLGGSRYVLIEFPHQTVPSYADALFFDLQIEGYVPIIAHPERNQLLTTEPNRLYHFASNGILSQVTTASIAGQFGQTIQKMSLLFLQHHLSHFVASDAHNVGARSFFWREARDVMNRTLGTDETDMIIQRNQLVLMDEIIVSPTPLPMKKTWRGKWK